MDPFHKFKAVGFSILTLSCSLLLMSGCTNNANVQAPSQQDVQLASNIIGESMSNDGGGLISSFGDATSMVSASGLGFSTNPNLNNVPMVASTTDSLRGHEINFRATYDPTTGVHTVDFDRQVYNPNFSKTVKAHLEYIYRDSTGNFLRFPRRLQVFSVDFKGSRSGTVQTPSKKSDFSRIDTLFYSGLNRSSSTITINGSHAGHGDFQMTNKDGVQISKVYDLNLKLLNVSIDKSSITSKDLTQGVTGTLSYDLTFHKTRDTTAVDKHITGTIDMNGDGTALLKFAHFTNRYLINLKTGAASIN